MEHHEQRIELELLRDIVYELRQSRHELRDIKHILLRQHEVARFIITQQGEINMPTQGPLTGIAPGASGSFAAQPVDASGNPQTLAAGVVPVWSSSDSTDAITPAADGLTASVAVSASASAGSTHTLSVALPDGTANSPVSLPILGTAPAPVASFVVTQTA